MASPGGYLPLAPGVSSVRYPIRQRTFEYVATVQKMIRANKRKAKLKAKHLRQRARATA